MTIKELVERLPKHIQCTLEDYKKKYNNLPERSDEIRCRMAGYVQGLRDANVITERERQKLFIYMTV